MPSHTTKSTSLSVNATTGDLSLGGKSLATTVYVDEKLAEINITNPPFTAPISQTLTTANGTNKGNIAVGVGALTNYFSNDIGEHNTAIGNEALTNNTNGYNTAVGYTALNANTTGGKNTALGHETLVRNTTGRFNTGLGKNAFWGNTTQNNNTGVGHQAAFSGAAGDNNTIVGASSCENNRIGSHNSTLGTNSLYNGCGDLNVAVGYNAGRNSKQYNDNLGLTNNRNTFLGSLSNLINNTNTFSNSTAVGYNSQITASNEIVLGTVTETVRIPKFTTAGVVRSDASGNLSSTGLIVAADITDNAVITAKIADAAITSAKIAPDVALSGAPTAPTPATSDNSTKIATTAFVSTALAGFTGGSGGSGEVADGSITSAKIATNVALAGSPTTTTPATNDSSTKIATTEFVNNKNYAPLASPAFTGTVTGITSAMVGLGNVSNTSDANKPISTATQSALDLMATIEDLNEQTLYSNSYYANDNKVDIQTALDKSGAAQGVVVFASSGSYGGSNLLINDRQNIGIIAPVVGNVTITELPSSRGIDISGANSTRVRLTGIQVKGMTTINGTLGRHYFSNMNFQGGLTFTGSMTNWVTFNNCDFSTSFTVNSTFAGTIYLVNCAFNGVTLTLNNTSPIQVILSNCSGLGAYPSALKSYLAGINSLSSGISSIATSTATVSSLATVGVVHNNASGVLSTSLIVTADITDAAITNAKLASGIDKSKVGLTNVDNTSDADKPVSTLTQSALDLKANKTELNVMSTTEPQSPVTGAFWFDITNGLLKVYTGSDWLSFSPVM
jgi:hypothetical protein